MCHFFTEDFHSRHEILKQLIAQRKISDICLTHVQYEGIMRAIGYIAQLVRA